VNYYRLRQVDLGGTAEYSKVVSVDIRSLRDFGYLKVYPNPVSGGMLTVALPENLEGETPVQLFDAAGRLVRLAVPGGADVLEVTDLAAGTYLLRAGGVYEKIVVLR
jgi:hypothetical protein